MNKDQSLLFNYIKTLIIGFIAALILYSTFWKAGTDIVHSILESSSLFIGVSIFLIIWNTINEIPDTNHILGFAILAVVIFDACHIYLFSILSSPNSIPGFSIKILGFSKINRSHCLIFNVFRYIYNKG